MRKRIHPRQPSAAERNPTPWLYIFLTIICAAFLATGFFFAARQHFTAMNLGMKNSTLRKQLEDMEGEQRRLMLSREMVRSPAEIKRIARGHGFRENDYGIVPVQAAVKPNGAKLLVTKTELTIPSNGSNVDRKPVKVFFPLTTAKPQVVPKPAKREAPAKPAKIPTDNAVAKLR
jgi:hypothetical protein